MHGGMESPQLHFWWGATHPDVAVLPQSPHSPCPPARTLLQYPITVPVVPNGFLMDGRAPAPIPLEPKRRVSMVASAPGPILAGMPQQTRAFRVGSMSRFECAGPLAVHPPATCHGHVRGRSASPMYRIKSAQMLPSAGVFERQAVGSVPAPSSTAIVSTCTASARPLPAARSFSSPPARRDSVAVKKALDVYRAFVPPLAKSVPQSAGSISATAGASPTLLQRSLNSKVPVPVQIAIRVDSEPHNNGRALEVSSLVEARVSKLAMDVGDLSDATRASTPTNPPVPNSPSAPDGRSCISSMTAFKRRLSAEEVAQVKDLLSRPSGLYELREGTWKEFGWALAANGHAPGKPGHLDYPHALTALRQLVYLNGLPALDVEATTQFLHARAARVALPSSKVVAAIGADELYEALLDLLRAAVNFSTGDVLEFTSIGSTVQS
mmetsp:Transcript_74836/g.148269  ORF Transcript_74836/g.148269 Transcript_74836/m.148269 type:complete len:438 (-) Transcript_74836:2-1315(-)